MVERQRGVGSGLREQWGFFTLLSGVWSVEGHFVPLFDLCLQMTRQEIKEERSF